MKMLSFEKGKGNQGEVLFESSISEYTIPHKIDGSKDLGIDYICEWKIGEKPTGVMFTAQVKNYSSRKVTFIGKDQKLNLLQTYKISPAISVAQSTQEYWKLIGMPCYLFIVITRENTFDLFYKRYTPIVTAGASQSRSPFYKVNNGLKFFAFADANENIGGFARDLYIDQIRLNYSKGMIVYINPRRLGLKQFPDQDRDVFFKDIFQEYKTNFEETFRQLRSALESDNEEQAIPSLAPPNKDDD